MTPDPEQNAPVESQWSWSCPVSVDCFRLDQNSLDAFLLEHLLVFDRRTVAEG
jgi:hypothetical protein